MQVMSPAGLKTCTQNLSGFRNLMHQVSSDPAFFFEEARPGWRCDQSGFHAGQQHGSGAEAAGLASPERDEAGLSIFSSDFETSAEV